MSRPHQRIFAFILALFFFATAAAGGAVVIWQIKKDNDAQKLLQQTVANNGKDKNPEINNSTPQEGTMLQGTKLANFTPVDSVPELQKIDLKEGDGAVVSPGATVTAHYTGALAKDGIIFQSSHDTGNPVPFSLDEVIKGWTEGVPGMKVGGIRRLLIPYSLAYADHPREGSGIPVNADLVFDIEVVDVANP